MITLHWISSVWAAAACSFWMGLFIWRYSRRFVSGTLRLWVIIVLFYYDHNKWSWAFMSEAPDKWELQKYYTYWLTVVFLLNPQLPVLQAQLYGRNLCPLSFLFNISEIMESKWEKLILVLHIHEFACTYHLVLITVCLFCYSHCVMFILLASQI